LCNEYNEERTFLHAYLQTYPRIVKKRQGVAFLEATNRFIFQSKQVRSKSTEKLLNI